ncbi:hypothetical protein N9452_02700 [Alphaproteobacteria bacterium]|nr:hypothetical protein [Alphaproteobacteria bacterium]
MSKGSKSNIADDKPEEERKHRIIGNGWADKAILLDMLFDFVKSETDHFITLEKKPYVSGFDPELVLTSLVPVNYRPLHQRIYWATKDLDGYKGGDDKRAEIRIQRKLGSGYWEQSLKLSGRNDPQKGAGKTIVRQEYERDVDSFRIDLGLFPKKAEQAARSVFGDKPLKPLICLQGQGIPVLYHPDGRADILFEIKFDKGKGFSFDGEQCEVVEVEIELKENLGGAAAEEIEALLDKSDRALYKKSPNQLVPSIESKPARLFAHLNKWCEEDPDAFGHAFDALPDDRWVAQQRF